jgi:hypothetical protein
MCHCMLDLVQDFPSQIAIAGLLEAASVLEIFSGFYRYVAGDHGHPGR